MTPAPPPPALPDSRTFAKEIAVALRLADAPLSAHQVVTLALYLKVRFGE